MVFLLFRDSLPLNVDSSKIGVQNVFKNPLLLQENAGGVRWNRGGYIIFIKLSVWVDNFYVSLQKEKYQV